MIILYYLWPHTIAMSTVVEEWLTNCNGLRKRRLSKSINKLLSDPYLWLCLKHSEEAVNDTLGNPGKLNKVPEDYYDKRLGICSELLKRSDNDGTSYLEHLKVFLAEKSVKTDKDLREKLFPCFREFAVEHVLLGVQPSDVDFSPQSESNSTVLQGIVSDLYPLENGWEGYISTKDDGLFIFTSESCNCVFPLYLGSTVQFSLTKSLVANGSLKVILYFPGTLPDGYATKYLQQLESMLEVSHRLDAIFQLPGPFATILKEKCLYDSKHLAILAILNSLSNDESGLVHTLLNLPASEFMHMLPQHICTCQPQNEEMNVIVLYSLRLVAFCVDSNPDYAYTVSSIIQGYCTRVAELFPREFAVEGANLSRAVIYACSTVRSKEDLLPLKDVTNNETSEGGTFSHDVILDPLLWVAFFFGEPIADSLRSQISQKPLCNDDPNVAARRHSENIIVQSLDTEKHQNTQVHAVKQMHLSFASTKDSKLMTLLGIVTDLYPDGVGYITPTLICGHHGKHDQSHRIFKLDRTLTTVTVKPQTIHIGDLVTFQVSKEHMNTVHNVLKVKQYCAHSLDMEFAEEYSKSEGVFHNEPALTGILNAPQVFHIPEVCIELITLAYESLSDLTASTKKKMLELLKSSCFIRELIDIIPQEVVRSARVLKHYLEQFPNEICVLTPTLESMTDILLEQGKPLELGKFLSFLSTSVCLLPPIIEIEKQPWKSIPIILNQNECKAGAIDNLAYLPKVQDHYRSVDEYGRTYFLLLRADCLGRLAKTISHLREPGKKESEIPVCDATFHSLSKGGNGHRLVYHFTMKTLPLQNISQDTPLFKQNNLLCLSVGGQFEDDLIWATINYIYVHPEDTKDGVVKSCDVLLEFCTEYNKWSDEDAIQRLKASKNVVALESPAYFRAYQPVLDTLKRMDLQQIHFIQDFIDPGSRIKTTLSLIDNDTIVADLAGLYRDDDKKDIVTPLTVEELKTKLEDGHNNDFCLHQFQRKAVYQALTQPLSLIQGPPGTGKSYIGMQLLRLFLSMKKSSGELILHNKPALVMAYKNRALDLFILMCEDFCSLKHIVRIGHVSKDNEEKLKPCLLRDRVMSALPRNGTVERMNNEYERVEKAKSELEALPMLKGMEDFLDSLTPEWLRSLIVDSKVKLPAIDMNVIHLIRNNPVKCLNLLQRKQMGMGDCETKKAIVTVLKEAWDKWVDGASHWTMSNAQDTAEKRSYNTYDNDTEYDPVETVMEYESMGNPENIFELRTCETFAKEFYDDLKKVAPLEVSNVWELDGDDRRRLIVSALRDRHERAMEELKESMKIYNMTREIYQKRYEKKAIEILKQAKIVAMTTTGAAIHQQLLSELEAPVVIVEEAAEILESNLLAVLNPHVKHMVLIGDHKQLKPNLAWPKLEQHRFNLSMFERLIRNYYPHTLLLRQNRMHRSLVPLFAYHYHRQQIQSHEKTEELKHPTCMENNFFWWSYAQKYEDKRVTSLFNMHEVEMVVSLCCWLVCNGINSKSIAILTPYRGQLEVIEKSLGDKANRYKAMPSTLADIHVYTVDEYQGHERDVVILSLVRSNTNGKIGFLSKHNRLVVGTSRQKCALYIIGNCEFLEKSSPMLWKEFIEKCKNTFNNPIDTNLPIKVGENTVHCASSCELESRVMEILKVIENNDSSMGVTNMTYSTTGSIPNTPTSTRSLSFVDTPSSIQSLSAASTPVSTRSQSIDTSFSVTPPQSLPTSTSDQASLHMPATRQQSSPAALATNHRRSTTRDNTPEHVEVTSSLPQGRGLKAYALKLKDTQAAINWKFIGRRLGLSDTVIDVIDKQHSSDIKEKFYQMMLKWEETKGERATKEELIRVLKKENMTAIVEQIN